MKNLLILCLIFYISFVQPIKADEPSGDERTMNTVDTLLQSTVKIQVDADSTGTGFFVAPDTVLTNEHVIHSADYTTIIIFPDGHSCTASIGYREENLDLALLHSSCPNSSVLTLTESYRVGQTVVSVGNPHLFDFTASKGMISADRSGYIQFDARANSGASGSPVADLNGNVVGITTAKSKDNDYMTFAVKASDINQFLQRSR